MKKLILATLLFSSAAFAQGVPEPQCKNGKLAYINQEHVMADFCIEQLKAKSPQHCAEIAAGLGGEKFEIQYQLYLEARTKEICGRK